MPVSWSARPATPAGTGGSATPCSPPRQGGRGGSTRSAPGDAPRESPAHPPEQSAQAPLQALPIPEAGRALGLSVVTIRRRLKRGELRGQRLPTPAGFEWRIPLPAPLVDAAETARGPAQGTPQGGDRGSPRQEAGE